MKVLFVISGGRLGGHKRSAANIGEELRCRGMETHFVVDRLESEDERFDTDRLFDGSPWFESADSTHFRGYYYRTRVVWHLVREHQYDLIVAMDKRAGYHASIPACIFRVPLLQIIAGMGAVAVRRRPCMTDMVVVYTEEDKAALQERWHVPDEQIKILPARLNARLFSFVAKNPETVGKELFRIAYISRIHSSKRQAFTCFLAELKALPTDLPEVQVDVVGEGEDMAAWRECCERMALPPSLRIHFVGYQAVTADFDRRFNLVVAQGRGVLEAISSGVPAAICGNNGYMGCLTTGTIDKYARTNFTGRECAPASSLGVDIAELNAGRSAASELRDLADYVCEHYSTEVFVDYLTQILADPNLNLIPGYGSLFATLWMNLRGIPKKNQVPNNPGSRP